jgi:hypothetical protein
MVLDRSHLCPHPIPKRRSCRFYPHVSSLPLTPLLSTDVPDYLGPIPPHQPSADYGANIPLPYPLTFP